MTPATVLLITQLLSLAAQAATSIIALRQQASTASSSTEMANLDAAEVNLQTVLAHSQAALAPAKAAA